MGGRAVLTADRGSVTVEFFLVLGYDGESTSSLAMADPGIRALHLTQEMQCMNWVALGDGTYPYSVSARSRPFRVVAPPAEAAGALELLQSHPPAMRDMYRLRTSLSTRWVLEKLVRDYPSSRYTPYCLHALEVLARSLVGTLVGQEAEAERLGLRILREWPDYPRRGQIMVHLADLYRDTSRLDASVAMSYKLVEESEDNLFLFRDASVMQPLIGGSRNPYNWINEACWELYGMTRTPNPYFLMQFDQSR